MSIDTQPAHVGDPAGAPLSGATRAIMGVLLVAAFVVILNETAMNVALTRIMADLAVTERVAQWLTTAFMLTMAVVIPVTGWLIDRLLTKASFLLAMGLFSAGTLLCAIAPGFAFLLGGRIVQAAGTAIMMPLLMTTIMKLVPPARRGSVMGAISMVISAAPAIGPTMSGVILQVAGWRFVFLTVLPIALAMLVLGWRLLTDVGERRHTPLDLVSVPLAILGFGGLVYGLSLIGDASVPFWEPMLGIGLGLAGLLAFVVRQLVLQRQDGALLDLRTFGYPIFSVALLIMAIAMMALFGTIIVLPLLLQKAYGMTPLSVGLLLLPGSLLMGFLSPLVGRLYDRIGPRWLIVPASVVIAGLFAAFSTLNPATPWWFVMGCHMVMSLCFAFMFTPLFTVSLGALPERLYSHGSALVGTVQQVAGAAGTALFVTVFAMQTQAATARGLAPDAAMLDGAHWAFLGAGAVWTCAILAALFVRKPPDEIS